MGQAATWGELGVEELQELELDSKALVRSGGWEARGRLGLPSRPFLRNVFVRFRCEKYLRDLVVRQDFVARNIFERYL